MENIDIICCMLSNLKIEDIIQCSMINKLFNEAHNMQYYRLLINDYGNIPTKHFFKNQFKQIYIDCYTLDIFRVKYSNIDNFVKFFSINGLIFKFKEITEIPESIGKLSNLQKLWLNNNQITEIPESIEQLVNCKIER